MARVALRLYTAVMDPLSGHKGAAAFLYPAIDPFDQRVLDVGDGHRLYVEQCGRPDGLPVVVLHGGPGGGCSPAMRRYFDPEVYRVVLFDQRGCGRSRPHACIEANTTWHLVADIERIREALGVDRWTVFGGSWGATLGLIYAQTHPAGVRHLILRGIFLMTRAELAWFYGGGAGQFWPDVWARFTAPIPDDERGDLIAAYNRRLFSGDMASETRHARVWAAWENTLASISNDGPGGREPGRVCARLCPAGEPLFHQRRVPRRRRPRAAQHGADRGAARHDRAGALRHDLPAGVGAPAARGLAGLDQMRMSRCSGAMPRSSTIRLML